MNAKRIFQSFGLAAAFVSLAVTVRADFGNSASYGSGGSNGGGATNGIQMSSGSGTNTSLRTPTLINPTMSGQIFGPVLSTNFQGMFGVISNAEINVKSYGAKGDGVTDDTAAFQAALNVLFSGYYGALANEPTLVIPSGHYMLSAPLYNGAGTVVVNNDAYAMGAGITIKGAGSGFTVLEYPAGYTGIGFAFTNNPIQGVTLRDLKIIGPFKTSNAGAGSSSIGMMFGQPPSGTTFPTVGRHIAVKNCVIYSWGEGVYTCNNWGVQIENCFFGSNTLSGVYSTGTHGLNVKECTFDAGYSGSWFAGEGVGFHYPTGTTGPGDTGCIDTCVISHMTNGIFNDELQLTTRANNMEGNGSHFTMVGPPTVGTGWSSIGDYTLDYNIPPLVTNFVAQILLSTYSAGNTTIASPNFDPGFGRPFFNVTNTVGQAYSLPTVLNATLTGRYNTNTAVTGGLRVANLVGGTVITNSRIANVGGQLPAVSSMYEMDATTSYGIFGYGPAKFPFAYTVTLDCGANPQAMTNTWFPQGFRPFEFVQGDCYGTGGYLNLAEPYQPGVQSSRLPPLRLTAWCPDYSHGNTNYIGSVWGFLPVDGSTSLSASSAALQIGLVGNPQSWMQGANVTTETFASKMQIDLNGNVTNNTLSTSMVTNNGVVWLCASNAPTGTWPIGSMYSRRDTGDLYLFKSGAWHVVTAP